MLLALDIATRTGWALGGPSDGSPRTGTWKLPGLDDMQLDRSLQVLDDSITGLCKIARVEIVAIEAPLMMQNRSAHTALGLISCAAVARCAAQRHGARIVMAQVQTVRRHFVGHGRPDDPKRAVMDRCKLLGWTVADDNAADAAALWSFAMSANYRHWAPKSTPLFGRAAA